MIGIGVRELLMNSAAVTALVGDRMYPLVLPDTPPAEPCMTYQLISRVPGYTLDGPLGCIKERLQIDAWAPSYTDAVNLSMAVSAVLDGYSGTLPTGELVLNTMSDHGMTNFEKYSRLYRVQMDWMFVYSAS